MWTRGGDSGLGTRGSGLGTWVSGLGGLGAPGLGTRGWGLGTREIVLSLEPRAPRPEHRAPTRGRRRLEPEPGDELDDPGGVRAGEVGHLVFIRIVADWPIVVDRGAVDRHRAGHRTKFALLNAFSTSMRNSAFVLPNSRTA